jgi:thiamine pyrophosphokinase
MSSHHIVREKQEPALLVLGLDNFSLEQLGQLLEWSPTVIATPLTAEELNSLGIKIDWIIGGSSVDKIQSDVKNIVVGAETATNAALKFLVANGYPSVNVITDRFLLDDYSNYVAQINIVVFYNQLKIYAIPSIFSKWKPSGEKIGLLSPANNLSLTGLKNIAPNKYITTGDGFFGINHDGRFLFIAEEI